MAALLLLVLLFGALPGRAMPVQSAVVPGSDRFTLPGLAAVMSVSPAVHERHQAFSLARPPVSVRAFNPDAPADGSLRESAPDSVLPAKRPVREEVSERMPRYFEYEVQPGDTVGDIAERFSVSPNSVSWNNVDLENVDLLTPGQRLQIPALDGILHSVGLNETVTQIATAYDADWRDIVAFEGNDLARDPNTIAPGSLILVPGGRRLPTATTRQRPAVTPGAQWAWPLRGPLTSFFGASHPLGIDIAAPFGAPLLAARDGVVTFTGGDPCCSYGLHVIVEHDGGYETVYAHLDSAVVAAGDDVAAGDVIGYNGLTGLTTGPHLHFELRRNSVYQDPLEYLP